MLNLRQRNLDNFIALFYIEDIELHMLKKA
jgi:hypothetical protein